MTQDVHEDIRVGFHCTFWRLFHSGVSGVLSHALLEVKKVIELLHRP